MEGEYRSVPSGRAPPPFHVETGRVHTARGDTSPRPDSAKG